MANSVDSDQLASSEANLSGSTLFAKAVHIRAQQDLGKSNYTNSSWNKFCINNIRENITPVSHIKLLKFRIITHLAL